jgi:flagellar motor switch protein FliN/FliY
MMKEDIVAVSKFMSDLADAGYDVPEEAGDAAAAQPQGGRNVDTILKIPVIVQVVLGQASMPVSNLLKLGRGAIVPLDHRVGEPVDVMVNGRVIARGEIVVVEDDNSRFGVSLTEIVSPSAVAA